MPTSRYRVGPLLIDAQARELTVDDESLPLEPRAFDLLVYLVQNSDRAVPKDELIDEVWRGRVVTDGVLYRSVKLVREALRALGDPSQILRTVHRVGYRFTAEVEAVSAGDQPANTACFAIALRGSGAVDDLPSLVALGGDDDVRRFRALAPDAALKPVLDLQRRSPDVAIGVHFGRTANAETVAVADALSEIALGRQILLSAAAFEQFRAYGAGDAGAGMDWLAHGPYRLVESGLVTSLYEVGARPHAPMKRPDDTAVAHRSGAEDVILGWRAAPARTIPGRPHWRLLECLGEGGFGEAWLAHHSKTDERRVFKFCYRADRLRSLQREVTLFRLINETLGKRPDIARILDWNFETPPYFVESEFSAAGDLSQWAEAQGGLREIPRSRRLSLIAGVAEALAAAHSVGVLHKDVKPANILIRERGQSEPQPVLADFGVGLISDRRALDDLSITRLGLSETATDIRRSANSGTRRYMAPELLEGRPSSIQADIYSLGIVLYQIVVGDFSRVLAPGWEREIDDELLRGDIAAMVEGDSDRRISDAGEVARRLRSLDDRHRAKQRALREAAKREQEQARRRVLSIVAGVALAMLALLAVQNYRVGQERLRAEQAAADAQREAAKSRSVAAFIDELFDAANPLYQAQQPSMRDFIELGARRIDGELSDQPAVRSELGRTLGTAFTALGDFQRSHELLQRAIEDAVRAGDRDAELAARLELAGQQNERGDFDDVDRQLAAAEALLTGYPEADADVWRSQILAVRSRTLYYRSDPRGAAELLSEAIRFRARHVAEDELTLAHMRARLAGYSAAGGRIPLHEITQLYEQALAVMERRAPESILTMQIMGDYARHLAVVGRNDEAEAIARRALSVAVGRLGPEHRYTAGLQHMVGNMSDDFAEGETLLTSSRDTRARLLGDHMLTSNSEWALANWYLRHGRWEQAVAAGERAHAMRERVAAENPGALAESGRTLGSALIAAGRPEDGLEVLERALERSLRGPGSDHWLTATVRRAQVPALLALGETERANDEAGEALRVVAQRYDQDTSMWQETAVRKVEALLALDRSAEADEIIEQLLAADRVAPGVRDRIAQLRPDGSTVDAEPVSTR